jgi:hypothetical protein
VLGIQPPEGDSGVYGTPASAVSDIVGETGGTMCRNIRTLFNFEPPATREEVRASSLQFVRKLSGFNKPSQANEAAFDRAVDEVEAAARRLIGSLVTNAEPRDRETEVLKARERNAARFGPGSLAR